MFLFLFCIPSLYAYLSLYGGRDVPETLTLHHCDHVELVAPTTWSNFLNLCILIPRYFSSLWCRLWLSVDFWFLMRANDWVNFTFWFAGEDRTIPQTRSTGVFVLPAVEWSVYVFLWTIMLLNCIGRRSTFKVKFRPTAIILALCMLMLLVYVSQPFHSWSWIHSTRVTYDYCPSCTSRLSDSSSPPFLAWRWHHDISTLISRSAFLFWLLSLYAFGPDYRIHLYLDPKDWDALIPFQNTDNFDHNARGDKSNMRNAEYLTVVTRRTVWYHIFRHAWYCKTSSSDRDKKLCSWELLRQCLNPSSLSPLIDDKTAIDRIARSAANNQTVAISKYALTHGHDVYGNTVSVAVSIRQALFDRARSCEDFDNLNPP